MRSNSKRRAKKWRKKSQQNQLAIWRFCEQSRTRDARSPKTGDAWYASQHHFRNPSRDDRRARSRSYDQQARARITRNARIVLCKALLLYQ